MVDDENQPRRMSARMVEERYIALQEQMQTYRRARSQGNAAAGLGPDEDPVILLQDAVETFFHIIRPFLENEPRLAEYWHGALAQHPEEQHQRIDAAMQWYRENSVGVWQAQQHTGFVPSVEFQTTFDGNGATNAVADGGQESATLSEWHDMLNLSGNTRVLRVEPTHDDESADGWYYVEGRFAILGLREIKDWRVRTQTERVSGDGFMSGETATQEVRKPEPAQKVETAAEMLVDVADELEAIASYEPAGDRVHGTPVPDK